MYVIMIWFYELRNIDVHINSIYVEVILLLQIKQIITHILVSLISGSYEPFIVAPTKSLGWPSIQILSLQSSDLIVHHHMSLLACVYLIVYLWHEKKCFKTIFIITGDLKAFNLLMLALLYNRLLLSMGKILSPIYFQ